MRKRTTRGAAALLMVMLLAAVSATLLSAWYANQDSQRRSELEREAGRVFAAWVLAAHRASQERQAQLSNTQAVIFQPQVLRGWGTVPVGLPLPRQGTVTLGVIDDGNGVPMAFGILEPRDNVAVRALRMGALDGGLAQLATAGDDTTPMSSHQPALEAALGRSFSGNTLFATADFGIEYLEDTLYRRPQPGRPRLNRMETDLDSGEQDILAAGVVGGRSMTVRGEAVMGGPSRVGGDAEARSLRAGEFEARDLRTAQLEVRNRLLVGRAVTRILTTGALRASRHLEAGSLVSQGELRAASLVVVDRAAITGEFRVRSLDAPELAVDSTLTASGIDTAGIYGPDAVIDTLTTGQCSGC